MKKIFTICCLLATIAIHAQIGIGTATPDPKAALDISATGKGLLIPRMDSATRVAISNPPDGLMIFQTDHRIGFWYCVAGSWLYIPDKTSSGDNLGNHTATQPVNLQNQLLVGADVLNGAAGSTGIRINGAGQVGIDATSPAQLLQLGSSNYPKPAFLRLGAGNGTAQRQWELGINVNPNQLSDVTGENYSFALRDVTANATRMMVNYTTGGVGIGTSAPGNSRLAVQTGGASENGLYVGLTGTSTAPSLKLEHNGSNFIVRPNSAGGNSTVVENTGGGALILNPIAGNVGIGTTSPVARFEVNGTFKLGTTNSTSLSSLGQATAGFNGGTIPANSSAAFQFNVGQPASAAVMFNPSIDLPDGIILCYVRTDASGTIYGKMYNVKNVAVVVPNFNATITWVK